MIGTTLAGRYRVVRTLGAGGHSTVYLAHDETLDREVALKILHREMTSDDAQRERFEREARSVARLSHPNVVTVIDAGEDEGGHPYIVFEFVEGETLKQLIRARGQLEIPEAVAYAIEIALGLGAAHARSLVHRDVKPQNVLIDSEGRAKITDFGIARSLEADGLTATGRVLGTTDYVSPEQALGHEVDGRSDIYSLGVVLYEMLTGEVPFKAESPVGVAMKHVRDALPNIQARRPGVSAALAAVLERATAKEPRRRHPSAVVLIDELERALEVEAARAGSTTGEATTVLAAVRRRRPGGRRWGTLAAAAVVVVAVAAAVTALVDGGSSEDGPSEIRSEVAELRLRPNAAHDFDPQGDAAEHPGEIGLAVDGDPRTTSWTTETYSDAGLGSQKEGVGIYVDARRPVRAKAVQVRSQRGGWSFEVRASRDGVPPRDLDGWTVVGSADGARRSQAVDLRTGNRLFRYYLVWITRLAPSESSGSFSVAVSDIRLFG